MTPLSFVLCHCGSLELMLHMQLEAFFFSESVMLWMWKEQEGGICKMSEVLSETSTFITVCKC